MEMQGRRLTTGNRKLPRNSDESEIINNKELSVYKDPRANVCSKAEPVKKYHSCLSVCCIHFLFRTPSHLNSRSVESTGNKARERYQHDFHTRTMHMNEWQKTHSRPRDAQRSVTMADYRRQW